MIQDMFVPSFNMFHSVLDLVVYTKVRMLSDLLMLDLRNADESSHLQDNRHMVEKMELHACQEKLDNVHAKA